jgi:hypothetical protein
MSDTLYDVRFVPNFCCLLVGASRCGKTTLFKRIIQAPHLFQEYPQRIYICHQGQRTDQYAPLTEWKNVQFLHNTYAPLDEIEESGESALIFVDDCTEQYLARHANDLLQTAVICGHHSRISLILAVHQLFYRPLRQIRIQCQYIVLFDIPLAADSVKKFANQFCPGDSRAFVHAYEAATRSKHGYLLCDTTSTLPRDLRLRAHITENPIHVYGVTTSSS